jgi:hypothetical protein
MRQRPRSTPNHRAETAKAWASKQIANLMTKEAKLSWGLDSDSDQPVLPWESLVCNAPV